MERKVAKQVKRSVSVNLSAEDVAAAVRKFARAPADADALFIYADDGVLEGVELTYELAPKQHAPAVE